MFKEQFKTERQIARKIARVVYRAQNYPQQLTEEEKLILVHVAKTTMDEEKSKQ